MSKLEKVIAPCDKKQTTINELMFSCHGVYPAYIVDKFEQSKPYDMGFLSVSLSKGGDQLNCCLFKKSSDEKLDLIQRFALRDSSMKQLRALLRVET